VLPSKNCAVAALLHLPLQVQVDPGVAKYVLMRLRDQRCGRSKLLVWAATAAAYHNHIYQHAKGEVRRLCPSGMLQLDVLGGGRIEHYPDQGVLSVYGYSAAFGPAPHELAAAVLRQWYPFYGSKGISVSYEGY
jgi:phosphohistidine phosphatase